jgi:hypothetical protein
MLILTAVTLPGVVRSEVSPLPLLFTFIEATSNEGD